VRRSAFSLLTVTAIVSVGFLSTGCDAVGGKSAPAAAEPTGAVSGAISLVSGSAASNGVSGDGTVGQTTASAPPPARWIQLDAADSSLGTTVAEVHGLKLYRFDKDKNKPSASECYDQCAATWPPVTIAPGGNVYVTGVDKSKVSAIRRTDGAVQLTLNGAPMYTYSGDKAPGDLNGQAVDSEWFAFAPDGSKITGLLGAGTDGGSSDAGADSTTSLKSKQTDQGIVVTDEKGAVVYRNVKDAKEPSAGTCADDCTKQWKPVTAKPGSTVTVDGLDKSRVGSWQRPDGTTQLTLDKYPLYVSTQDKDDSSLVEGVSVQGWYPAK
jgi:predicted lipoprotein with Yx(FWY)xxD motif